MSNEKGSYYVPPAYTPVNPEDPDHPPVPPPPQYTHYPPQESYPPQQHYPVQQYPPQQQYPQAGYPPNQYSHYPPQDQHYGYSQPQPAAVVVGITEEEHPHEHEHKHVSEHFSEQLNKLPRRMWYAITRPRVSEYNGLKQHATIEMCFFILMVIIIWSIILELIYFAITKDSGVGFGILAAIIGTLVFFFLANLLFHGIALCLGGEHKSDKMQMFIQLCYLILLFGFPLDILGILTIIPFVGIVIAVLLFVYKIVLTVITIRAVYNVQLCHAICILVVYLIVIFAILLVFGLLAGSVYVLALLRTA